MSEEAVPFLGPEQQEDIDIDSEDVLRSPQVSRAHRRRSRCFILGLVAALTAASFVVLSALYRGLGIFHAYTDKQAADQRWIATSNSATDRFFSGWNA